MISITLLLIFWIAFTGCATNRTIVYVPVLPVRPALVDPGRPIANGDETDELEIILKMAHTIEVLELWADNAINAIGRLSTLDTP